MTKRILLTGAAGFTGLRFTKAAQQAGYVVHPLVADLTDAKAVATEVAAAAPDFVVHLAGISAVTHADEEAQDENLILKEIIASVIKGEVIEQYQKDKPYPSCLILGNDIKNNPVHSVWAYNGETKASILITVYRPDPNKWMNDNKTRRR